MRRWRDIKKSGTSAGHVDDWMMTYVDMITLLLCFFAVMLIVAISKKGVPPVPPPPVAIIQKQVVDEIAVAPPPVLPKEPDMIQGNLPFHDLTTEEDTSTNAPAIAHASADTQPVEAAAQAVQAPVPDPIPVPATLTDILNNLKSQGQANLEQKGDRLTTIDINSAAFFDRGSATLTAAGVVVLHDVASNLKAQQYKDYMITVEGHTDDTPIHTAQFPSNWELSTSRASAVVRYFLEQGLSAQHLRAAGYADSFPKAPNRTATGEAIPANQATNRRVVIKLEKIDKN